MIFLGPCQLLLDSGKSQLCREINATRGTNIPLSTEGNQIDAWKEVNPREPCAKQVITDFLTGKMANGIFALYVKRHLNRIESAFFACGWRVNLNAMRQANQDMRENNAVNAFSSKAWRQSPPFKVDEFKGEEIEELMRLMREDAGNIGGGNEGDDEHGRPNDGQKTHRASHVTSDSESDDESSIEDSDVEGNDPREHEREHRR